MMRRETSLRLDAGKRDDAERSAGLRGGGTRIDFGLRHDANHVAGKIDEGEDAGIVEGTATRRSGQGGWRGLPAVTPDLTSQY